MLSMTKDKRPVVFLRWPTELVAEVDAYAEAMGVNRNAVVIMLVREALRRRSRS